MTPNIQTGQLQAKLLLSRSEGSDKPCRPMTGRRETEDAARPGLRQPHALIRDVRQKIQATSVEVLEEVGAAHSGSSKSTAESTAKSPAKSVAQGCEKVSTLSRPPAVITGSVTTPRPMTTRPPRFLKWWGSGSHRPGTREVNPDGGRAACRPKSGEGTFEGGGVGNGGTETDWVWVPRWLSTSRVSTARAGRFEAPQDASSLLLHRGAGFPVLWPLWRCAHRRSGGVRWEVSDGR
jgi:hypothetical protein